MNENYKKIDKDYLFLASKINTILNYIVAKECEFIKLTLLL